MTPGRLLVLFAFYAAALELGASRGLVAAVASPVGLLLLASAGALSARRAVRAARAPDATPLRAARVLASAGAALALLGVPASLALRDSRQLTVGELQDLPAERLPGLPPIRFGEVRVAPRGPHVLSKTVTVQAALEGEPPVEVGLFPPAAVGPWRMSVSRYGYAVGVDWQLAGVEPVQAYVMIGTLAHAEEEASLVEWTPETNVMMGAGTFPPKLEELVPAPGGAAHLFVRLDAATIAGARRDLRDPNAYAWLVDGRLEDPEFFVQAFRGKEKVFEGKVRGGERRELPGGAFELAPDVLFWVDLLAVRDPFLPWAAAGLGLVAAGLALRGALSIRAGLQRARLRASGS